MSLKQFTRSTTKWFAAGFGIAGVTYATYVAATWWRYGNTPKPDAEGMDAMLDSFMPRYEVVDRHHIRVAAPAEVTLSAASEMDLASCSTIRGIFKGREIILRSKPDNQAQPRGLVEGMKFLGWGVLGELPGREIVMGAVTKPWEPNPVFRALPPDEFEAFQEGDYVKIVWTLRADPVGNGESVFRTETRAIATDVTARKKFRRYWSFLSPGIRAIRSVIVPAVKHEAERRWRAIAA